MKVRIAATGAALITVVALSGCATGSGGGNDVATVDVGIVQLPIFAPIYVAEAKGYFDDEGLDVNLENVKSGQDAIPLASSGKLDVVAAGFSAGMFSAIETGLDVRVVGSMGVAGPEGEEPASALVARKELVDSGEVTSVADLAGHKLGALGGDAATSAFYVTLALEEEGLAATDVEFVNLSSPDVPAGLKSGGIDAAFVSAPFWNQAVDDGIAEKIWQTPQGTSGTGVIYGGEFAQTSEAQAFFDAIARAAKDLQGDDRYSDENLEIIGEATDQSAEDVASVPLYHWEPDLKPLPDQLATMERVWIELGALDYDEPLDPDLYLDSSFSDNVSE